MSVTDTPVQVASPVARDVAKPLRSRYLLVVLLPLVALVSAVLWSITLYAGAGSAAETYARGTIPGQVTVEVHPGTWVVFAEATIRDFTVRVVAADGTDVPVRYIRGEGGYLYDYQGAQATAVAAFDVPVGVVEQYTVTSVGEADSQGAFAVGEDSQITWSRVNMWATAALLLVNVGAAAAIVVVPIVRYRRRRSAVAAI